jgi:carbamoyltransferase
MLKLSRSLHERTGMKRLCLAGGVALNCVANGHILRDGRYEDLWIQPAAGDAGGAVGVAFLIDNVALGRPRLERMEHASYGPAYSDAEIRAYLDQAGARYVECGRAALIARTVDALEGQNVVGWFQGRMEFGPRALGNRSILGDPRSPAMQDTMNLKIKFRESFRPFAPSVLLEHAGDWFDFDTRRHSSPYMLLVCQVADRRFHADGAAPDDPRRLQKMSEIPAVTHVDGSARLQTVEREHNPLYYDLIEAWRQRTGCPVLINTSFNVRGEPIVCTPHDAYLCFMRTRMDHLVLGPFLLVKIDQPPLREDVDWRRQFELD